MSRRTYRMLAAALSGTILALGFALLLVTALHGGGSSGYVIGALFVGLGGGRLYLLRKRG
jgi:hypothetical protein